ncbi:MarR family transcriptional regulator, partial [Vibrio sp. 10N.222.48.A4]
HNQLHLSLVNELTQDIEEDEKAVLLKCLSKMVKAF